jgi:hypothetical protein
MNNILKTEANIFKPQLENLANNYTYNSVFNAEDINMLYSDDLESAYVMFDMIAQEVDNYVTELQELTQKNAYADIAKMVHKVGPPFKYIGLPKLAEEMHELQKQILNNTDGAETPVLCNTVLTHLKNMAPLIKQEAINLNMALQS